MLFNEDVESRDDPFPLCSSDEISLNRRQSHCSFCGHPGSRKAHFKSSCDSCNTGIGEGCTRKAEGFKCDCISCDKVH